MQKLVVAVGEVLWDLLPSATILGGAPFNFVYRVNSLNDRGIIVSRLGEDVFGRQAVGKVENLGLDSKYLQWDTQYPTGTVKVSFDEDRNPDYVIVPGVAYDHLQTSPALEDLVKQANCFCFGTLIQRELPAREALKSILAHAGNAIKFLDINLRKKCYSKETIEFSLRQANILKLNDEEVAPTASIVDISYRTLPEFCEKIATNWELDYCLVTLGENGAFGFSNEGERVYVPGYKVVLADPLGSGDAFSAGFVHRILGGASFAAACEFGNVLGSLAATKPGATAEISHDEIAQFLEEPRERNINSRLAEYQI